MSVSETVAVAVFIRTVAVADSRAAWQCRVRGRRCQTRILGLGHQAQPSVYFYYALPEAYNVM